MDDIYSGAWLLIFSTRHYVAFIRKVLPGSNQNSWVLYNDEKVVKAGNFEEMKQFAYVYFFSRSEVTA